MSPLEGPPQRNALDILEPLGEGLSRPFLDQIWGGLVGSTMGFGLFSFTNYMRHRPPLSGIQRHIGGAIALGTLMHYGYEYRRSYYAERDAVYRHYVETHPDDFIYPVRQRYSEVLLPWTPIR